MPEFLRGWRRKVGCVVLFVACVMLGMWLKSRFMADTLTLPISHSTTLTISFFKRGIVLVSLTEVGKFDARSIYPRFQWTSERYPDRRTPGEIPSPIDAMAEEAVFGFNYYGESSGFESFRILLIPFLSVVGPLTLLSAYLLLYRPRRVTDPAKPVNSVHTDELSGRPV